VITQTNHRSTNIVHDHASDEALISACRRGEAAAWSLLVHRYQRLIYAIPLRAGLDEDQAAEVFQGTFAKLFEYLDRIRQPASIQAWLVTTAKRETLRLIREQSTKRFFASIEDLDGTHNSETIPDDNPLPDEAIEELEQQHMIHTAMTNMDERCRQLLTLLYYQPEPPTYSDVAATLGMPEGSLGPTRARCLEKLRRLLDHSDF
jgi:RNA polymerase sigma factor (sigma-70 family)